MECPRCGADRLQRYELDGREAISCERCGYLGIPVNHASNGSREAESWEEALARFRARSERAEE
jgi:Zn ribbon nucleic-acid-binding protein